METVRGIILQALARTGCDLEQVVGKTTVELAEILLDRYDYINGKARRDQNEFVARDSGAEPVDSREHMGDVRL